MTRRAVSLTLVACALLPALFGFVAGSAATKPGSLDRSFGKKGQTAVDFGNTDQAIAVALQRDGKVVIAGRATNAAGQGSFAIARLRANGATDSSFGTKGKTIADFGGEDSAFGIALQRDGRIVVVGNTTKGTAGSGVVARLAANGLYDKTFGSRGWTTVDSPGAADAVALRPNGAIVVGGTTNSSLAIAQLTTKGELDASFGAGGKTIGYSGRGETVYDLALQRDGMIVTAGGAKGTTANDMTVARVNTKGLYDQGFGERGTRTIDFGGDEAANAVALLANGKILVAGRSKDANGYHVVVARLTAAGALDPSFGKGGKATVDIGQEAYAAAMALQPNGRILIAGGTWKNPKLYDFLVLRLKPGGALDGSFGTGGKAIVNLGGDEYVNALALRPDGRIVVAGYGKNGAGNPDFAIARLLGAPRR